MRTVSLEDFDHSKSNAKFSPRSKQALLLTGIDPEGLVTHDLAYFREQAAGSTGLESEDGFIRRKCEHYSDKRKQDLHIVKQKRKEIIRQERDAGKKSSHDTGPTMLEQEGAEKDAAMIQMEQKRVERMKESQLKDLQKLLQSETRRQELEDRNKVAAELARENELREAAEAKKRARQHDEEKRQQEQEKMRQTEEEEERQVRRARQMQAETMRLAEQMQADEARKREERKKMEEEKAEITRQKREVVEAQQQELMQAAQDRAHEREVKDQERVEKLAQQRAQTAAESAEAAAQREIKQRTAKERNDRILEEKAEDFEHRKHLAEDRKAEQDRVRERDLEVEREALRQKEADRKRMREQAEERVQEKVNSALAKSNETDQRLAEREDQKRVDAEHIRLEEEENQKVRSGKLKLARAREQERIEEIKRKRTELDANSLKAGERLHKRVEEEKIERKLTQQDRLDYQARMQRVQEYERQQILKKIEHDSVRVATMKDQKAQLMQQRLQLRAGADEQRRKIMEEFERMKKKSNPKDLDPETGLPRAFAALLSPNAGSSKPSRVGSANASPRRRGDMHVSPLPKSVPKKKLSSPAKTERKQQRSEEKRRQKIEKEREANESQDSYGDDYEDEAPTKSEGGTSDHKEEVQERAQSQPLASVRNDAPRRNTEIKGALRTLPEKRRRPQSKEEAPTHHRRTPQKTRVVYSDDSPYKNKFNFSLLGPSSSAGRLPSTRKDAPRSIGKSRSLGKLRNVKSDQGQRMYVIHNKSQIPRAEAERQIEDLAAEQNGYLLMLLEKERSNEEERERIFHAVKSSSERKRLDRIFSIERSNASDIINAITQEHETVLSSRMEELGLLGNRGTPQR